MRRSRPRLSRRRRGPEASYSCLTSTASALRTDPTPRDPRRTPLRHRAGDRGAGRVRGRRVRPARSAGRAHRRGRRHEGPPLARRRRRRSLAYPRIVADLAQRSATVPRGDELVATGACVQAAAVLHRRPPDEVARRLATSAGRRPRSRSRHRRRRHPRPPTRARAPPHQGDRALHEQERELSRDGRESR